MADQAGARSQIAQLVLAGVVLLVLLVLTGPLQYLPRCVLAAIVFTIAVGMIDVAQLRDIRRESPGEFYLAIVTAATVVAIGVEQGILLAIALSLFRHVRHSYRPHTMMLVPDATGRWILVPATAGQGDRTRAHRLSLRCGSVLCQSKPLYRRSARARRARADAGTLVHRRCGSDHRYRLLRRALHARSARGSGAPQGRHDVRARQPLLARPTWIGTALRRSLGANRIFGSLHEAIAAGARRRARSGEPRIG